MQNPLTKQEFVVPSADSADNVYAMDVVGNKSDTHAGDSLYSKVMRAEQHIHSASKVYPTLADGVTITSVSGAGTWTLGTVVQVVPASTITNDFDVHYVSIESISANGVFELVLYYGAGDTEAGRVRFTKNAAQDSVLNIPIQTVIIPADSRVRAALASIDDGGQTADISLFYHEY